MAADHIELDKLAASAKPGRTLVVGSRVYGECIDRRSLYQSALGVDMQDGEGVDLVHNLEKPLPKFVGTFDHVDCCSVLEHVRRPWKMADNILDALNPNGTLLISVPFVWRLHDYPGDYWRITHKGLEVLFPGMRWLHQKFLVDGRFMRGSPKFTDEKGRRWIARTEVVALASKT